MKKISVFLSDCQVVVREGIHFALSDEEDIEVTGETTSNEDALSFIESNPPRVAILSANGGKLTGGEVIRRIKENLPRVSVILLLDSENEEQLFSAMKSGASACVTKDVDPSDLINIVRKVARGGEPISEALLRPGLSARVLDEFKVFSSIGKPAAKQLAHLTLGEAEILRHIAERSPGQPAAGTLGMGREAISQQLALILHKLVSNNHIRQAVEAVERISPPVRSAQLHEESRKPERGVEVTPVVSQEPEGTIQHKLKEPEATEPSLSQQEMVGYAEPISETVKVWQDVRITRLLEQMLAGELTRIEPKLNPHSDLGFSYPEAEQILQTTDKELVPILDSLVREDILVRHFADKVLLCPQCHSVHLRPGTYCRKCGSRNIFSGTILEHFSCGCVGLEDEFKVGIKYVCPKCRKELKVVGADYRSLGVLYKCQEPGCREIFNMPALKWSCLQCGALILEKEPEELRIYAYALNEARRNWLQFELRPKAQLIQFLKGRGYKVTEAVKIRGRSGAEHTIGMLAVRDDGIIKQILAIEVIVAADSKVGIDEVLYFNAKTDDVGCNGKVIIVVPEIHEEARRFAEQHRIQVFKLGELEKVVSSKPETYPPSLQESGEEVVIWKARLRGDSGAEHTPHIYPA